MPKGKELLELCAYMIPKFYFKSKKKGQINPALFNFISNYLAGGT